MISPVWSARPRRGWRGLAGLGLGLLVGCSLVTGFDGFTGRTPKRPPAPSDAGGGDGPVRRAAATALRFEAATAADPLGYDLDNQCTCPDVSSCRSSDATDAGICDNGNVCIDNQIDSFRIELTKALAGNAAGAAAEARGALVTSSFRENLSFGKHGILVEIGGWDGQPNDDSITFSILNVTDVNGAGKIAPNAVNVFAVDPASLPGGEPVVTTGYVTRNTVVVRGFSFDFSLLLRVPETETNPEVPIRVQANLRNALFVGTFLEQTDNTFRMSNATLTGALPIVLVQQQLLNLGFCPGVKQGNVDVFERLCAGRDLSFTDPNNLEAGCDAISFAMALQLDPATREGGTLEPEPGVTPPDDFYTCGRASPGCP